MSQAEDAVLRVLGVVIAVIPLFAMPFMFKVAGMSLSAFGKMARRTKDGFSKQAGDSRIGQFVTQKKDNAMSRLAGQERIGGRTGMWINRFGNRKFAREDKYKKQDAFAKRAQQNILAERTAEDERYALAAAGVAGRQGAGLVRAQAVQQQEKEEQEYRDAARVSWDELYPKDKPELARKVFEGAKNGTSSNTEIQGGLSALLNGGGPGRAQAAALMGNKEFMTGFAGENPQAAQKRFEAVMKVATGNQDFGIIDSKLQHLVPQVASYQKGEGARALDLRGTGFDPTTRQATTPGEYWKDAESRHILTGDGAYGGALQEQVKAVMRGEADAAVPSQAALELTMQNPKFADAHAKVQTGVRHALAQHDPTHKLLNGWDPTKDPLS